MKYENGFHNIENEEYHKAEGLSSSQLKALAQSAHAFYMKKKYPDLFEQGESGGQRLGTLEHMAILEPHRFDSIVRCVDGSRNATKVKEEIELHEKNGFYVCKTKEKRRAEVMKYESLRTSKRLSEFVNLPNAQKEISIIAEWDGLQVKCRPDLFWTNGKQLIVMDVKTFTDLSDEALMRQIFKMKYHWQSWWYLKVIELATGIKSNKFGHAFIDAKYFQARVIFLDDAALEKAEQEIGVLWERYKKGMTTGEWDAIPDEITDLSLPHYGFYE